MSGRDDDSEHRMPEYPGSRYVGEDREAVWPNAAELHAYDREWYDWAWNRYHNGEDAHPPDSPDGG